MAVFENLETPPFDCTYYLTSGTNRSGDATGRKSGAVCLRAETLAHAAQTSRDRATAPTGTARRDHYSSSNTTDNVGQINENSTICIAYSTVRDASSTAVQPTFGSKQE